MKNTPYNFTGLELDERSDLNEPTPYNLDGLVPAESKEDIADVLSPFVKPFLSLGYHTAAAFNRGMGTFCTHLDAINEYVEEKTLFKMSPDIWDDIANIYENNADYWAQKAKENGPNFVNELLGEAIGGAVPGIAEFALNVPYAGLLGAAEAHKESRSELIGAITNAGQRGVLGHLFRVISPFKQYLRAPAMGGIMAVQSAAEGAPPREVAKAMGTGMLYSASSPGGQMGLNEVRNNLRIQARISGAPAEKAKPAKEAIKPAKEEAPKPYITSEEKIAEVQKAVRKFKPLTESDPINGVPLGELVKLGATDPQQALLHIERSHVTPDRMLEGLRNKGMGLMPSIPKNQRGAAGKNLQILVSAVEEKIAAQKNIVTRQTRTTLEKGNSFFNLAKGDLTGEKAYAIPLFPKLSKKIKGNPTERDIDTFYKENYLLLKKYPELTVGTRFDKETGETSLDINVAIPHENKAGAVKIAQKYGQKAIIDVKEGAEISVKETAGKAQDTPLSVEALMAEVRRVSPLTALPEAEMLELARWATQENLVNLSPSMYGVGLKSGDIVRKESDPKHWVDRTYLSGENYIPELEPGKPQNYEVFALRKELYDFKGDKDGLLQKAKDVSKENPDINPINYYENLIKQKGYKGYFLTSEEGGTTVALFEKKTPAQVEKMYKKVSKEEIIKQKKEGIEVADKKDAKRIIAEFIRERRYNLNLENYKTNLFINEIEQKTTKEQREVIPFIIEKTKVPKELGRPDLEKINVEELKGIAEDVRQHFHEGWEKIKKYNPDMSVQEIENYVTHIWDVPKAKKNEITSWFITQNRFLKKRFIDTLEEGIRLGYKPKTLDIAEIIRIHDNVTNRVIANNQFVEKLNKLQREGVSLIQRADKAPQDWVFMDHPALRKPLFKPGEVREIEDISLELENLLKDMGVALERRVPAAAKVLGTYTGGEQPTIRLRRIADNHVIAHEIGHHIDQALNLGPAFLEAHKTELFNLNKARIEKHQGERYAETPSEQIAEFFAMLLTDPKEAHRIAPGATADALARMEKDGALERLIDFDFEKQAKNTIREQTNTLLKLPVKVHPDLKKPLDVIFAQRFDHPIVNALETVNGLLKKTKLSLSLFHHMALGETGIAFMGPAKTLKIYGDIPSLYKALKKGEHVAFKNIPLAKDAISHGVQLGATADIPVAHIQEMMNEWARKTENKKLIGKAAKFMAKSNSVWDKILWDYLHDNLKLYAYESAVSKLKPGKNIELQKREIAQLVNDTFGGQNWDVLMTSQQTLQLARLALLSPDWTLSTLRQALSVTGMGKLYKETGALRRKAGTYFWLRAAIYFGVGINLLNAFFRKQDEEEHPELYPDGERSFLDYTLFGNTIGHQTHLFVGRYEDGSERYVRYGKQFRELPELFMDDINFSPITASLKKLGGKLSPAIQLGSEIFTGYSPSGFKNKEIADAQSWERVEGIAKLILKSPLPFSTRSLFTEDKEMYATDIALPSSKGLSRYKAMKLFMVGLKKRDEEDGRRFIKEVFQGCIRNNLPAETLFTAALSSVKAESTKEYNKGIKTLDQAFKKLEEADDPEEIKRLKRTIRRLSKENNDRLIGIRALKKALYEAERYWSTSK